MSVIECNKRCKPPLETFRKISLDRFNLVSVTFCDIGSIMTDAYSYWSIGQTKLGLQYALSKTPKLRVLKHFRIIFAVDEA